MSEFTAFLAQNTAIADGEFDGEEVADYAQHHCGGLFVLLRHLDDGRVIKCHDSWGPPELGPVCVHVYDPDSTDDSDEEVLYPPDGTEAVRLFLDYQGDPA